MRTDPSTRSWTPFLLLPALAAASPAMAQTASCNDSGYRVVAPPGAESDSVQYADCPGNSLVVHLASGGDARPWRIVDGAAAADVTVSVVQPSRSRSYLIAFSGALLQCGPAQEGSHCTYPDDRKIAISVWRATGACSPVPVGSQGLPALLAVMDGSIRNGSCSLFPSNRLRDVTADEVGRDHRTVRSASVTRCTDGEQAPPPFELGETWTRDEQVFVALLGDLLSVDLDALVPGESLLPSTTTIRGFQTFLDLAFGRASVSRPEELTSAAALHPPLEWIDDLSCEVEPTLYPSPFNRLEQPRTERVALVGSFRRNGDFEVALPSATPDEGGGVRDSMLRWVRMNGNVFYCESGAEVGLILPAKNGASTIPLSMELWALPYVTAWVTNPFGDGLSPSYAYETERTEGGDLRVSRRFRWEYGGGVARNPSAEALLGGTWEALVTETPHGLRVMEQRTYRPRGSLLSKTSYGEFFEVAPGVWRPAEVRVEELGADGLLARHLALTFSGQVVEGEEPRRILPPPSTDLWLVRVQ